MKWFIEFELKKSKVNEIVYASGAMDAIAIAQAKVSNLLKSWNEQIIESHATSFETLGVMACNCHNTLSFYRGDYYYLGRKVNDDMNFLNGFGKEYEHIAKFTKLNEERERNYNG